MVGVYLVLEAIVFLVIAMPAILFDIHEYVHALHHRNSLNIVHIVSKGHFKMISMLRITELVAFLLLLVTLERHAREIAEVLDSFRDVAVYSVPPGTGIPASQCSAGNAEEAEKKVRDAHFG